MKVRRRFDMWILRFLLKLLTLPLILVLDIVILIMKASIFVGCYVAGAAVWLCGICCVIALFSKMIPCAIFFAVVLLVMIASLYLAADIQWYIQRAVGALKRI